MSNVGSRWYDDPASGTFMCCMCFEQVKFEDAWVCEHGQKWDNCVPCGEHDVAECKRRGIERTCPCKEREATVDRTVVCLECGRNFELDPFHFDCSGEHTCSAEEFTSLIETDQFVRTQNPCTAEHEGINSACPNCKAEV